MLSKTLILLQTAVYRIPSNDMEVFSAMVFCKIAWPAGILSVVQRNMLLPALASVPKREATGSSGTLVTSYINLHFYFSDEDYNLYFYIRQ